MNEVQFMVTLYNGNRSIKRLKIPPKLPHCFNVYPKMLPFQCLFFTEKYNNLKTNSKTWRWFPTASFNFHLYSPTAEGNIFTWSISYEMAVYSENFWCWRWKLGGGQLCHSISRGCVKMGFLVFYRLEKS